jgi:hypothetical protein
MFHNMHEQLIRMHANELRITGELSSIRSAPHDFRARRLSRKAERAAREARLSFARTH